METLGADFLELERELGHHLGFGRTIAEFSTEDSDSIVAWIKSGLRRFLYSAYQPKNENVYDWSFLHQMYTFGTHIGQFEYDLPANFGSPDSPIYWGSNQQGYIPIPFVNEALVRSKLSQTDTLTAVPRLAAIFQKRQDGSAEQRQGIVLWPKPDQNYPFRLSYSIQGTMLSEAFPWPPGSSPHARTLLYACLAEATKRHDDNDSYEQQYQMALAASINYDARQLGDTLGYCGDPKQRERGPWPYGPYGTDSEPFTDLRVLVHGVQY